MNCVICSCKKFSKIEKRVRDSIRHCVVKCEKCGHIQLSPIPSLIEEREFYNKNLQSKNISLPTKISDVSLNSYHDTKRRADFVSKYCSKKSRILDVGSGDGFFLKEMDKRGYEIMGLEVSNERRETSKRVAKVKVLDVDLTNKSITNENLGKFDCITLFHVLEHIINPVAFLQNIKKFIKTNGKIIIEVPNLKDALLLENKNYKDFYWQRAHLSYFYDNSLIKTIKKSGLLTKDVFFVQRYGLKNFMHWLVVGKPQIDEPIFQTNGKYKWLENYYKNYLCKSGKSDTLIVVAKVKI